MKTITVTIDETNNAWLCRVDVDGEAGALERHADVYDALLQAAGALEEYGRDVPRDRRDFDDLSLTGLREVDSNQIVALAHRIVAERSRLRAQVDAVMRQKVKSTFESLENLYTIDTLEPTLTPEQRLTRDAVATLLDDTEKKG